MLSLASKRFLGIDFPRGRDLGPVVTVWLLSLLVLVFEKDLGTALLYFGLFVVTLYVATERASWLIIGLLLFFGGVYVAYLLGDVGRRPVRQLLRPRRGLARPVRAANYDRIGGSYQLVQGLLGLGTGGLFGTGPGAGSPGFVPEVRTDFIFAGMGEEIGLFGLSALLVIYLLIVERGLRAALAVRDSFGKLVAGGLAFTLGLQVFVIVGGITGLIPLTGQTTPFLSAGGSSLMANWLLIAMLLRISDAGAPPGSRRAGEPGRRTEATAGPAARRHDGGDQAVNAPLRKAGVVILVLFGLLFANLNWVQGYKADEYRTSDYNRRVQVAEYERPRGVIEADGEPLAENKATDGTLKYLRVYPDKQLYAPVIGYKPVNNARDRHRAQRGRVPLRHQRQALRRPAQRHVHRRQHRRRQRRAVAEHHGPRRRPGRS